MTDKCQARWGDIICSTWCICTWIMWWGQMLIQYGCRCRKKGRKSPDTEAKCYKSPEPPGDAQFSKLLIWTFMWCKWLSLWCCAETLSQWKPERVFDIWKLKVSVGTRVFLFSCHGPAVSPCLDGCQVHPWWWILLVLLAIPGWIIKIRPPQLHRADELVTTCPTY